MSHLSTITTTLQWPLFYVLIDSPYLNSYFKLSSVATFHNGDSNASKVGPNCQNNLTTMAS